MLEKMKEVSDVFPFYRELKLFMIVSLFLGTLVVGLLSWNIIDLLSFFIGGILGYINFLTLKKEGRDLIFKVYNNVINCVEPPYQKERLAFLIKVYLRLLALGIIFYFLLIKAKFSVVCLLMGFTVVYLQIFLVTLKYWIQKEKIF